MSLCEIALFLCRIRLFLSCFRAFCAVFGTSLHSVCYTSCIQSTSNDVVTYTRKVFYSTASDQNNGVFLQVVAFTGDICCNFDTVGQTNSGNFSQSRVRLLRCGSFYRCTNASFLRRGYVCSFFLQGVQTFLQSGCCRFFLNSFSAFSY